MISHMLSRNLKSLLLFFPFAGCTVGALGYTPAPGLTSSDLWKAEHVPFSFQYDGKQSAQLLTTWQVSHNKAA
jgi:hypothetical protein